MLEGFDGYVKLEYCVGVQGKNTSPIERLKDLGSGEAWRRQGSVDTFCWLSSMSKVPTRHLEREFLQGV